MTFAKNDPTLLGNKYREGKTPWNKNKKLPFYAHTKAKGRTPWNKGVAIGDKCGKKPNLESVNCLECNKLFTARVVDRRKYCSLICSNRNHARKGIDHPLWKDDKAGYSALHYWIARELGKPKECDECGFTSDNNRQFHWANISGDYLRDIDDWERLCVRCHMKQGVPMNTRFIMQGHKL